MNSSLKILIYSSNENNASLISSSIKDILMSMKCEFELSVYRNSKKIFDNLTLTPYFYDILVLDINDCDTFEIAGIVRKANLEASLIFISEINIDISNIKPLFKFRPTGVITGCYDSNGITNYFKYAYTEQKNINPKFIIRTREQIISIHYNDIDYFENLQRKVIMYSSTRREHITFYSKFEDLYSLLPKNRFLRCHQSLIVNMQAIHTLDKSNREFVLYSGTSIDISKRYLHNVSETFNIYCQTYRKSEINN